MPPATITVLYPHGATFNMTYYQTTHMPLVQAKWGAFGLQSWKVVQIGGGADAPYCVQATLEFESLQAFQEAASSPAAKEVLGDVPNFSDRDPVILAGEVVFTSSSSKD